MSNRKRWFRLISCLLIALLLAGNMQFTKAYAAQAPEEMFVANGYYQIATALNEKQVLDIKSGSLKDRANVQLWENHDAGQQRFYIKKLSNGYYNIQAFHSGKMVDVTGASTAIKTNVQQYKSNGNAAQQWKFLDAGNGYCYIQSRLGTYLDCEMGHSENGSNVWTYKYNGSNAQKWKLKKEGGAVFIPDKTMNTNCWMKNCSVSVKVSQKLDVKSSASWLNSISYANGKLNFRVDSNFGNARKGKLTVKCGDDLQEITVNQSKYAKPLSSGLYTIGSKLNTKKLLDVKSQSKKNSANIQLWESTGNNNQKFQVTYLGSGYYSIINCNSGKSLDVAGKDKKKSKSNLQQYTYVKNSAQQWRIHYVGKNTFYIQSKLGTYIDAQDGKSGNSNNVWMYNFNGSKAQQWVFSKTTKKVNPPASKNLKIGGVDIGYAAGQYFSENGKACTCHEKGICINNPSKCNCILVNGTAQCYAFALWCENKMFGFNDKSKASKFKNAGSVSPGRLTESKIKSLISKVPVGAHIRTKGSSHSMILMSKNSKGFTVAQANGSNNKEYRGHYACRIGTSTYTWKSYVQSSYGKRGIAFIKYPK